MKSNNIDIKLTPLSYSKRQGRILKWTLLLYLIVIIVVGLNTDLNGFLLTMTFLFVLFSLDYSRRLRWVRFSLESIGTNSSGVKLKYYDKDNLETRTIPWNKLSVIKGSTFTKNPTKTICFKSELDIVAFFYASDNFDNEKIEDLYNKIEKLRLDNA